MATIQNISRRDFLKTTGTAGALVIGANFVPGGLVKEAQAQAVAKPNLFVSIEGDGMVTITCSRAEMGQGARTGIPMILADELEADWDRCKLWQAPGDETKYDPAGKDGQNTDGSRSTRHHLDVMRELGAAARYTLEMAAARKWGVNIGDVYARHHRVYNARSGKSLDYGELVDIASQINLPAGEAAPSIALKDKSQWKYIGKDMPGVDNFDITTGGADFGADINLPGMKIAVIERSPVYRGKVKSFDASAALKVPGVEKVVQIPHLPDDKPQEFRAMGGIAVIGTNTWSVMEGRKKLKIKWDSGPNRVHSSRSYDNKLREEGRRSRSQSRQL